jgi:hypothetical protein
MGLKVFTKVTEQGATFYRVAQDGLGFIDRFFTKRLVFLSEKDFALVLRIRVQQKQQQHLPFADCSSEAQTQLEKLAIGPAVVHLQAVQPEQQQQQQSLAVNVWIGKNAVLPRISKTSRLELLKQLVGAATKEMKSTQTTE